MKKNRKIVLIALVTVVVLAVTLGAVAIAQADDAPAVSSNTTSIWDRVAAIFKQNTGTTVQAEDLKTAFQQAQEQAKDEALDNMLKNLVDSGKITQKQADDYKAWLAARPEINTDALKQWLESRPDGVPFGPGLRGPMMPRVRGFCR